MAVTVNLINEVCMHFRCICHSRPRPLNSWSCSLLQIMNVYRYSSTSALTRAISRIRSTSEKLTGQSDVLVAQQVVRAKKEELREWRQKLTQATTSYEEVQRRLKGLYTKKAQVYQDQRRDVAAIQAVNDEEEDLLVSEQSCFFDLEHCQQKERECFEGLSDSIQESHEKERAKSDQMKYYSRLGSLMGAVFGFLGSNLFLRREIRQHNTKHAEKMNAIETTLLQIQNHESPTNKRKGSITSSNQEQTSSFKEVELKLTRAETKIDELNAKLKSNYAILERISSHLCLQAHAHTPSDTLTVSTSPQSLKGHHISGKDDMVALAGVVAYSVLLAVLSLFR